MGKAKKVLNVILNVIIWIFVAFSIVVTILAFAAQANAYGVPSIGGKAVLSVQSDSMKPTFAAGDLLISDMLSGDAERASLKVDDIISYKVDLNGDGIDEVNTHRIVSINTDDNGNVISYQTKGDNNTIDDDYTVVPSDVVCTWNGVKVNGLGNALSYLQTSTGFLVCIVLPLVLFFLFELFNFIKTLIKVKNEDAKKITAADEEAIKQKAIEEYIRQQQLAEEAKQKAESSETAPTDGDASAAPETDNKTENESDGASEGDNKE